MGKIYVPPKNVGDPPDFKKFITRGHKMGKKQSNPHPPKGTVKPSPPPTPPKKKAWMNNWYCKDCGMAWYNCLCCHEDL